MRIQRLVVVCVLMMALAPSVAHADGYFVPFAGVNFGGDVGQPLGVAVEERNRTTFGFGLGAMGGGVFGIELDVGYTSNFYGQTNSELTKNNVLTVVPALIIGTPLGGQQGPGLRPYALAGAGLVRREIELAGQPSVSENNLAYTLGFGVMGFFSDHVGLRGDVRYLRNITVDDISLTGVSFEDGTFSFGRASLALLLRL